MLFFVVWGTCLSPVSVYLSIHYPKPSLEYYLDVDHDGCVSKRDKSGKKCRIKVKELSE